LNSIKDGIKGIPFNFTHSKYEKTRDGIEYPVIRRSQEKDKPDGILRHTPIYLLVYIDVDLKPEFSVHKAFEYLNDKFWHRYLFPFGCFQWEEIPVTTHNGWKDWADGMCKRDERYVNIYSVTAADILYLCNTVGYLERFIYIVGVILWAKKHGCNLLRYDRRIGWY
jgi:hypothetical protein